MIFYCVSISRVSKAGFLTFLGIVGLRMTQSYPKSNYSRCLLKKSKRIVNFTTQTNTLRYVEKLIYFNMVKNIK